MSDFATIDDTDLFLKHFESKAAPQGEPSKPEWEEEKTTETPTNEQEPETSEDAEEPSEEEQEPERQYAEDGLFVRIKIGEEVHEVPVQDLQRLYGQEVSLTQKSQQAAESRKALQEEQTRQLAASNALLNYAQQRWAPYAQIDFLALSRDPSISQEQFQALRSEAQERYNELAFLQGQTTEYISHLQEQQKVEMGKAALEAVKQITDEASPYHIPGWSEPLYDQIRTYAVNQGMDKNIVNSLVDPSAMKMLYKAMQYDQGSSKVQTTKVNKQVTRVVKTSRAPEGTASKGTSAKATDRLRASGSVDDAANAFLARFKDIGGVD